MLSTPNPVTPFIVGIDAASLELAAPPEVFAPAFRFLREYPIEMRRRYTTKETFGKYEEISSLVKNRRLGMTYHVGEDFRHILSGLRAIHEVIEFLKPHPGDRLGHAIALGLSPEVWAAQAGYQAVIHMQEWLDNLVWVHHLLGPGHNLIGELAVEDLIQRYSRKIYQKSNSPKKPGKEETGLDLTPPTLYDSWRLRQLDPYSVDSTQLVDNKFSILQRGHGLEHNRWADVQKKVLEEVNQYVGTDSAYDIVRHYWYNYKVRDIDDRFITIDMLEKKTSWLKVCHEVQERLQDIVRKKQLVVEVNPTSNRVVGQMAKLEDHPVFLMTLDKQHRLSRENRVTINADDPGVFSTSLIHEFYLLGGILMEKGVPEAEVVEWLEWLRKNGEDYSFLRDLPKAKDKRVQAILGCLLDRYESLAGRLRGKKIQYRPPRTRIKSKPAQKEEFKQLEARLKELEEWRRWLPNSP